MTNLPNKNESPLGIGMIGVAWLLIMAAAALWYHEWSEQQYNPNRKVSGNSNNTSTTIKLTANKQHQYVAKGRIGNITGVFIVDTGATAVVVPQRLAKEANLQPGAPAKAMTANGLITVYNTIIPVMNIGPLVIRNVEANINPASQGSGILLGMSALKDMEILHSNGVLTITQEN
jgi:aspartyl protease family protein